MVVSPYATVPVLSCLFHEAVSSAEIDFAIQLIGDPWLHKELLPRTARVRAPYLGVEVKEPRSFLDGMVTKVV
jgi:hypothetical protein